MIVWRIRETNGGHYFVLARTMNSAIEVLKNATGLIEVNGLFPTAVRPGEIISVEFWDAAKFKDEWAAQVITDEQYERGSL